MCLCVLGLSKRFSRIASHSRAPISSSETTSISSGSVLCSSSSPACDTARRIHPVDYMTIFAVAPDTTGQTALSGFPEFPSEKPDKSTLKSWLETTTEIANASGFGCFMRNEEPYEIAKLVARPRVPVPADATLAAAAASKNLDIDHANSLIKMERDAKMRELQNRFAAKLGQAMKKRASLRLASLRAKYQLKDTAGNAVPGSFNGAAMFEDLRTLMNAADDGTTYKKHLQTVERLRDTRLPNNCSPQEWSDRMTEFQLANELNEEPYAGAKLVKTMVGMLPKCWSTDVRQLVQAVKTSMDAEVDGTFAW